MLMLVVSLKPGLQPKCLKIILPSTAFRCIGEIVRNVKGEVFLSMSRTASSHAFIVSVTTLKYFGLKFISVITVFTLPLVTTPNPKYNPVDFVTQLFSTIRSVIDSDVCRVFLITGDFNALSSDFLEEGFGLNQLVYEKTDGNNLLDKVFTNRHDFFCSTVHRSLLKTKQLHIFCLLTISCWNWKSVHDS